MISPSFFCVGHLVGWQAEKFTKKDGELGLPGLHCIRNDLLVQFSAFLDQMLPQMLEGEKPFRTSKLAFFGEANCKVELEGTRRS